KLLARNIDFLEQPRPLYETYVYSPRMEGIHLRFGPVARGGIRYSDRREDFRAEILGLAKTQTVKNAVIVPVGAKGGFVVTRPLPDDPDAAAAEVVACYRTLIRGLLDLTDNLDPATGTVIPPDRTVRRDGDDTYLVVAADKGTATFSDIANEIAAEYHYWLADAFASGGSAGYDHKAMGITARGAWESVKRHFRELGVDIHRNTITCVGIGDMSGDVFGNGMLLSSNLKLVAAFDHRHIFLDPDPDPAVSYAERRRLFTLPRSSWADYDASRISPGGGVWPRSAKRIPVSTEAAAVLGIAPGDYVPTEVIRAILRAPVDLLWNGGIGTYVKASTESHADVGDRANDAVRIDAAELRCRVVAEGGNLGFTQPARVEYALRGGRINTDAIDNSAGVDTSDHEVNVKILLNVAQRAGRLDAGERHALLGTLSDEVAALVLRDNYEQNLALSCLEAEAAQHLHVHAAFIDALERAGILDRRLEHLPDPKSIAARAAAGRGLVRPELAILLAYAKIALTHELVRSSVPDEPFAHEVLREYFPTALRQRFAADMLRHPLQRDIMATCLANRVVNMSGVDFVYRLMEETCASAAECVRAHVAARRIFGIDDVWRRIEELDDDVPAQQQIRLLLSVRQSMARIAHWIVRHRRPLDNVGGIVDPLRPAGELVGRLADVLRGEEAAAVERVVAEYCASRVPDALARSVALLDHAVSALAVVDVAARLDGSISVTEAAEQYFLVAERLRLTALRRAIAALPHDDRWQALARSGVQEELLAVQADLAAAVLRGRGWSAEREQQVATIIQDAATTPSLAAITVALGALRALREDG
ncbi:MAG: NAD-glutamate dehydrogenase, partial [Acidothermus cellulolyticus]|nr:NAD-glutamate dehydrogenase [Acidothermus cellulolyticus]